MTPKDKLFKRIQMYGFALDEIRIYLDTHPYCKDGLEYYHKYKNIQEKAIAEYNRLYGPITSDQVESKEKWTWTDGPFPWERSAN